MPKTTNPVALVGCGYSELTRTPVDDEIDLVVSACEQAASDAGLSLSEVDGINIQVHHYPPPNTAEVARRLGMNNVTWQQDGGIGVPSLGVAARALDSSACDAILVCKVMNTTAPVMTPTINGTSGGVAGAEQFDVPYGLGYTMQRIGLTSRRWMHRFGITEEQVGSVCITQREHATMNPHAYFDQLLTMEDYLSSRWIADPVRLLDCDYAINGAFAYIMTRGDRAASLQQPPVHLVSWSDLPQPLEVAVMNFHVLPEDLEDGPTQWLQPMYDDARLGPKDMDVWMLYDGYSFFVMQWMESLGLVPRGESGNYVEGGSRIRFDGEHPVNTHGGNLSEGRLHGAGHILEAVQQLRGHAGARQAKNVDHVVISTGFPNAGSAAIFRRG